MSTSVDNDIILEYEPVMKGLSFESNISIGFGKEKRSFGQVRTPRRDLFISEHCQVEKTDGFLLHLSAAEKR